MGDYSDCHLVFVSCSFHITQSVEGCACCLVALLIVSKVDDLMAQWLIGACALGSGVLYVRGFALDSGHFIRCNAANETAVIQGCPDVHTQYKCVLFTSVVLQRRSTTLWFAFVLGIQNEETMNYANVIICQKKNINAFLYAGMPIFC